MKFRKLFFSFLFLIPGLFLIDVKAETTEPVSSKYFDIYSSEMLSRIETDYFNTALSDFDNRFNEIYSEYKKDYPYYMVIAQCHYSNNCYFQTYIFDSIPKFKWKTYYGNSKLYQILWNDESGVGNFNYKTTQQSLYINQSTTNINTLNFGSNVYNQSNVSWNSLVYNFSYNLENNRFYSSYGDFIYDCNFDILKEDDHALKSSRENVDIKINDTYYQADDVIPSYKEFKNPKPKTPIATFNSTNFGILTVTETKKNYVTDIKVDIEYSDFDTDKYSYFYSIIDNVDDDINFQEIYSTKNKIFSFHVKKNCYIIQKIVDKSTNEIVHTSTYNITGISFPIPNAKFNHLEDVHYDNDTSKPILYKLYELHFDFFNTDLYEYAYRDNYINSTITVKENNTKIYIWDNYNVPVTVYDKKTGDIVAEYNFSVNGITGSSTPIAFYEIVDVPRSCGDSEIIPVKEIYISFSFVYTEEFSYQYTIIKNPTDKITNWVDESSLRYNNDFYFKLEENSYIITRIINKSTNEIVYSSTYAITGIDQYDDYKCYFGSTYDENIAGLQRFLKELVDVRNDFQKLFYAFFNNLPEFVRVGIVAIYVIMLVILALQLGGWK